MTLRRLRHALLLRIRHPIGLLAGTLLLVAMVLAGTPITTLHAHEGGGRDHSHGAVASVAADADQDHGDQDLHKDAADPTETPSLDTVLHLHDVGTLLSTMHAVSALSLPELKFASLDAGLLATFPPSAARTPPHRPPIV